MNAEEVFARRGRYWERGYRPIEIWNFDQPTDDKGETIKNPGKQPRGRWVADAAHNPPAAVVKEPDPRALNTGLVCGEVVAFDIDVLDQSLVDQIVGLIERRLGPAPNRIGRSPKCALIYRAEHPFAKQKTAEFVLPDGTKALVELLADGQQFVADGIHPETGRPYYWTADSPEDVSVGELPVVSAELAEQIIREAADLIREAGGRERERDAPKDRAGPRANGFDPDGDSFFRAVNGAALANIGAWVTVLFPTAREQPGTGAWRVKSKDLGRDLEEDISIHPDGVRDFGEEESRSPIDLVIAHGPAGDAVEAALWLCERLGVDPAELGWHGNGAKASANGGGTDQEDDPDPEYIRAKLSFRGWITRDIPPLDRLLGDLLTTTSRVLLVAPTGLGKTNLCLAIAVAIAAGRDFLHWRVHAARRVLYVDGEMSDRLMKARAIDALRRVDAAPDTLAALDANLTILNRTDFPDMPPLDTVKGQQFVDRIIGLVGPVDLIILDNIQALQFGDMKDEEPWRRTLPWVRALTDRGIGQIWVHHTGHDASHSYGTKTREWQLDTMILLEQVEQPEADIAFAFSAPKARERTPDNRPDFDPAVITLASDAWSSVRGGHVRTGKRTATNRALELLREAIARDGTIPPASTHIPPATRCVTEGLWRAYCERGCLSEGSPDAIRKAFKRATEKLIGGQVGKWEPWVWIIG